MKQEIKNQPKDGVVAIVYEGVDGLFHWNELHVEHEKRDLRKVIVDQDFYAIFNDRDDAKKFCNEHNW